MHADPSNGWDGIAEQFMNVRSAIGASRVKAWAENTLQPGATIVDIGCGSGQPISTALVGAGFRIAGIDPSPKLIKAFRHTLPDMDAACETAEDSNFFGRTFEGAIAIGVMFLLSADAQKTLIRKVGEALTSGGYFLFSAPIQACDWTDTLTGRPSRSLGADAYQSLFASAGLTQTGSFFDEGENHYFEVRK